jgi:DNA-directed RNA polymerase specialized sigma24 family protein
MKIGTSNYRKAFDEESLPHLEALWRIARCLTLRDSLAEEILTNTMIRAYSEWPYSIDKISNKIRLFRILTREIFGFGTERQKLYHPGQFLSENIRITADSDSGNLRNTLSAIDQLQMKRPNGFSEESVWGIIANLRPQSRIILLLLYIGEFSYADIAFIMDLSRNSVRMILARVRKLIPEHMLEHVECLDKIAKSLPAFIWHSTESYVDNTSVLSIRPNLSSRMNITDATLVKLKKERRAVFGQKRE